MILVGRTVSCLLSGLVLCAAAQAVADAPAGPYRAIVESNVFRLKPPTPIEAVVQPKPPLPKITLIGITTILPTKVALIKIAAAPAKPGEPPNGERSCILAEGQRDGDIEVEQIDEKAGTVRVKYADTEMTLTFEEKGAKSPALLAANTPLPPGANPAGRRPFPAAMRRFPLATGMPPANAVDPAAAPLPAGATVLGANSSGAAEPPAAQATPPMTPEEQAVLMEVQRELHKNDPTYPALPATGR